MDINDIEHIIRILKQNEVTEFELEQDGTKIKLVRGPGQDFVASAGSVNLRPAVRVASEADAHPAVAESKPAAADDSGKYVKISSPIVGTFYRRPSPDAEAFVKEGDTVKKGDTLCIIEAMKLMNEIEAETSGKVVKILGTDGQVVEYGEVLFLIDPAA